MCFFCILSFDQLRIILKRSKISENLILLIPFYKKVSKIDFLTFEVFTLNFTMRGLFDITLNEGDITVIFDVIIVLPLNKLFI